MIPDYLSTAWETSSSALGNHLWQSTLFVGLVGLLTLALRNNRARARYWLWLAASVKFLIPFSLLVGIGSHIARPHAFAEVQPSVFFAMGEVSHPFIRPAISVIAPATSIDHLGFVHLLPAILLTLWLGGFIVILSLWCVRWRRISASLLEALPLREGREVEALRRLEHIEEVKKRIRLLLSPASAEPGIFGIVRPVLIWPKGITERLEDGQLEAILAHEMCHVSSYDNLTAAFHMMVEAIFWFHPLVWWLGTRLVEERERACDEAVLQLCKEPHIYAESILKVCEFCVESPLVCVSGVSGSDLKKRIVRIVTGRAALELDLGKKTLLVAVGLMAVAFPILFGQVKAAQGGATLHGEDETINAVFDAATIKPAAPSPDGHTHINYPEGGRFRAINITLLNLMEWAYDMPQKQILDGPAWMGSTRFDIQATTDPETDAMLRALSSDRDHAIKRSMVRRLLEGRFAMKLHRETRTLPAYDLGVAKGGSKLEASKANGKSIGVGRTHFNAEGLTTKLIAEQLSQIAGRVVVDKTNLDGRFDLKLQWTPDDAVATEGSPPSLFTAIEEQLGLQLKAAKEPVAVLVVDHIEPPSPN